MSEVPTHLGLILDGNRRWAKSQGLSSLEGHRRGYDNLKDLSRAAFDRGVKYVSAYIFSTENWNRSAEEVNYLMTLALRMVKRDLKELHKDNIRVRWLGSENKVGEKLLKALREAEETTKNNTGGQLCLCFNYGGQTEIAAAAEKLRGSNQPITIEAITSQLYAANVPPVDFLIRTSGEQRLSNFMLWRAAYAELYFVTKHWPAFTEEDLDEALAEFASRQRRFGK